MQFINTDDAGRFKTSGLAPGLYAMEVHWPGYVLSPDGTQPGIHRAGEHLTFNLIKGGVITGRVTEATGEPIVSATVIAHRTHDLEGRKAGRDSEWQRTDDRGVYRLYGLEPGRYVVRIDAGSGVYVGGGETGEETPTYYPSSARDAAVEITVRAGEEVGGIDIQRRGERGHTITGIVSGDPAVEGVSVKLVNANSGVIEKTAGLSKWDRFAFFGVPDGEYDLYAQKLYGQGGNAGSALRRVVVKGAGLFGVDLKLIKYGSISGRVVMDSAKAGRPAARCEGQARWRLEEIILDARSDNPAMRRQDQFFESFEIKNVAPGKYWLLARPAPEVESVEIQSKPVAWNDGERVKLRREAKKIEIELKPCQRLDDYALKTPLR